VKETTNDSKKPFFHTSVSVNSTKKKDYLDAIKYELYLRRFNVKSGFVLITTRLKKGYFCQT